MKKSTQSKKTTLASLSQLNPKCAGIDVGAAELFVCIAKNPSEQEVREIDGISIIEAAKVLKRDSGGLSRLANKLR